MKRKNSGVIYTIMTIFLFLFLIGILAFATSSAISATTDSLYPVINSYHNSSWTHYTMLGYAETFITNFWTYLLVIAVIGGLALWVYIYEQRKGAGF